MFIFHERLRYHQGTVRQRHFTPGNELSAVGQYETQHNVMRHILLKRTTTETLVRGHSRSLEMTPFGRSHVIVTY